MHSSSVFPRSRATPYSVTTTSRRCRGMVVWGYSQTTLEVGRPFRSRVLRIMRMERPSSMA